jgi:hypothetical protein
MKSALIALAIVALLTLGFGPAVYAWHGGCWGGGYGPGWMGPNQGDNYTVGPDNTADPRWTGPGQGYGRGYYARGGSDGWYGPHHGWGHHWGW